MAGYNNKMDNQENLQHDFVSTVSHELRTPLTSIRGFAQTMLSSWDALDDESKKKFILIIEQQSNRLINLVENMLSINKLQSFKDKLVYKSISVKKAVEPIFQMLKQQYPNFEYELSCNQSLPNIFVDVDKFQQVMTNLIENAAKYSNDEGKIQVLANFSDRTDLVSIKVINEGIGIEPEDYEKIFSKFSRLDNPLTRSVQGSGLGLYISKTLIEKMNGKITVQSDGGVTTFEILIPVENIENQAVRKLEQCDN